MRRQQQQQQQQQRQLFSEVCEHINAQNQVETIVHDHVTQQETISNTIQRMQQDEFVIAHLSSQLLKSDKKSENQNGKIWSCSVGGLMIQQGNTEQYIEELRRGIEQYQATIETCEQKCGQLRQQWKQLDPHDQFQLKHLMFPPNGQ